MITIARTREDLTRALDALPGTRALVMTMGALHEGHMTLVERASTLADHVVASVYVNPLQFGPGEDFDAYPRTLEADAALLEQHGVQVVFAPSDEEMYPSWPLLPAVRIDPGPVASLFEGATRPGHFAGVAQVVAKVINLVRPQVAVFGQKDAQQLAVLRSVHRDLDLPGRIEAVPISRDEDGLARSSRNTYLSAPERERALALSRALAAGVERSQEHGARAAEVLAAARRAWQAPAPEHLAQVPVELDYLDLVDATSFTPLATPAGVEGTGMAGAGFAGAPTGSPAATTEHALVEAVLIIAARVGTTRLIDNAPVRVTA